MQRGTRVAAASGLVPKGLRELLRPQQDPAAFERDLADYLERQGEALPVHIHTQQGVRRMVWEGSTFWDAKTELDLVSDRVRVQRILADKNRPEETLDSFVRIGEGLLGDLRNGRLVRLADASGWYAANLLQESQNVPAPAAPAELRYDSDPDAEPGWKEGPGPCPSGFEEVSAPFEVSREFFNDRKIGYPHDQRAGYLKDLSLKIESRPAAPGEGELSFRVTLVPGPGPVMTLKGSCVWDGRWCDFGSNFFKYIEHLNSPRSQALRKRSVKRRLAEAAAKLLSESGPARAEEIIELEVAQLSLENESARWEAAEYLRRFFKTFVRHEVESLLVRREGWCLVPVDVRRFGALFHELRQTFGGELFEWLQRREREVPLAELFAALRGLHARLSAMGIQLCYRDRAVKKASFHVRADAKKAPGADWFELHSEVSWDGRVLSPEEWRSILENQGVLEQREGLWVLEESSLKTLEAMRDLFGVRPRGAAAGPVRVERLHVFDWLQLRRLGAELKLDAETERLARRLLRFEKIESKPLPQGFRGQLRDYQKEGYNWLAFLYEHGLGGCLADDMGLGKTVQAIAFLGGVREGKIRFLRPPAKGPHLVVVPSTLVFNWKREFGHFYPEMDVCEYSGSARKPDFDGAEVVLTTYDILRREEDFFRRRRFPVVIFDEAQYMKNLTAKRTASARRLDCDFALTLTGTPLENHLGEYYSILDLTLPGLFGSYEEFRRAGFADPLGLLKKRAAPFVLRRTKDKTLKELPPKAETEVLLRMSPKQRTLYETVVSQARREVHNAFDRRPAGQAALSALTAILRLRQICVSPRILDRKIHERSPKIEYMVSKLREIVEEDHSALVFSQFTSFLDVLEEEIRREKLDFFRMDGTTSKSRRKALVDAFQCGAGAPIFLISLKTGGVGLNLTRASYVFHLDPWWNPAVENQASDRVHRIGQKKSVFVTRLLMQHTVEEKMRVLKEKKAQLYREVLEGILPKSGKPGRLSREDFDFLLG